MQTNAEKRSVCGKHHTTETFFQRRHPRLFVCAPAARPPTSLGVETIRSEINCKRGASEIFCVLYGRYTRASSLTTSKQII